MPLPTWSDPLADANGEAPPAPIEKATAAPPPTIQPGVMCAGCNRPIDTAAMLNLTDSETIHFNNYDCLFRYAKRQRQLAIEAFWRSIDLARCAGCDTLVRSDERTYDYARSNEVVARVHSDRLLCLIAWNERWHRVDGHEYNAAHYRQILEYELAAQSREQA